MLSARIWGLRRLGCRVLGLRGIMGYDHLEALKIMDACVTSPIPKP